MNRVVVTGMGVHCNLGSTLTQFWENLASGTLGIKPLEREYPGPVNIKVGAFLEVDCATLEEEPFAHYLSLAANSALSQAQLSSHRKAALIVGTAAGGQQTLDRTFDKLYTSKSQRVRPTSIPRIMVCCAATQLARELEIMGPSYTIGNACSSSAQAIGMGYQMVKQGTSDVAIVGGTEAPFTWGLLKSWEALRVVDSRPCRPFSADRAGMSLGEGAAVLILESESHAQARGAKILAEVSGYATNTWGAGQTGMSLEGAVECMTLALQSARLAPSKIDYINAHGTGTRQNDITETQAIHTVFESHSRELVVSSTKSMHGHALGAAGALEALVTVLALQHQQAPPTIGLSTLDPECDLDYLTQGSRKLTIRHALSNSFAFGGVNATLVFSSV